MQIIALQEYTDKYISLYQGEIRNLNKEIAERLIEQGIVRQHDTIDDTSGNNNNNNITFFEHIEGVSTQVENGYALGPLVYNEEMQIYSDKMNKMTFKFTVDGVKYILSAEEYVQFFNGTKTVGDLIGIAATSYSDATAIFSTPGEHSLQIDAILPEESEEQIISGVWLLYHNGGNDWSLRQPGNDGFKYFNITEHAGEWIIIDTSPVYFNNTHALAHIIENGDSDYTISCSFIYANGSENLYNATLGWENNALSVTETRIGQ